MDISVQKCFPYSVWIHHHEEFKLATLHDVASSTNAKQVKEKHNIFSPNNRIGL